MLKEFCSKCFIIIFSSNFAGKTLRNKLHQKEITKKKLASAEKKYKPPCQSALINKFYKKYQFEITNILKNI